MIKNCPKCSGESGFFITKTVRYTEFVDWKGLVIDVSSFDLRENKKIKCSDCGLLLKITAEIKAIITSRNG